MEIDYCYPGGAGESIHPSPSKLKSSQKLGRKVSGFGQITLKLEDKNITEEDEEMKKYVIKKSQLQEVIELYRNEVAGF